MENLKKFENFNDPNKKEIEKIQISAYITKSTFFSMEQKNIKDFIKKNVGKEFTNFKKDKLGDYIIETGDKTLKEVTIPKKYIYEIFKNNSII